MPLLQEIYFHLEDVDVQLAALHKQVERGFSKWRMPASTLPVPVRGSSIPLNLIVPVVLDCVLDGLLIGVAVEVSVRAGAILATVTCVEMASLGVAVSVRVKKCTGSPPLARWAVIYLPPMGIAVMSAVGGAMATTARAQHHSALMVILITFGMVMLLQLVIGELLPDAREVITNPFF